MIEFLIRLPRKKTNVIVAKFDKISNCYQILDKS